MSDLNTSLGENRPALRVLVYFPFRDIAGFRAEIDADQDNGYAAAAIPVRILFLPNLLNGGLRVLIALKFEDIHHLRNPDG